MKVINVSIMEDIMDISFHNKYKVSLKITPEFLREPFITDEDKIEFVAEEIKQQFIKHLNKDPQYKLQQERKEKLKKLNEI